ncbi:hypothetical protein BgiMline_015722, partial [Biomphalaria glabrata]
MVSVALCVNNCHMPICVATKEGCKQSLSRSTVICLSDDGLCVFFDKLGSRQSKSVEDQQIQGKNEIQ